MKNLFITVLILGSVATGSVQARTAGAGVTCPYDYRINHVFATDGGSDDCYGQFDILKAGKIVRIDGILFGVEGVPSDEACEKQLNILLTNRVNALCQGNSF